MKHLLKYNLIKEAKAKDWTKIYNDIMSRCKSILSNVDDEEIINIESIFNDTIKGKTARYWSKYFDLKWKEGYSKKRVDDEMDNFMFDSDSDDEVGQEDHKYITREWDQFIRNLKNKYDDVDVYFTMIFEYSTTEGYNLKKYQEEFEEIKDRCDDIGIVFRPDSEFPTLNFEIKLNKDLFLDGPIDSPMTKLSSFMDRKNLSEEEKRELIGIFLSKK